MRKLTLIIQAVALVVLLAVAMLVHSRHRTAPAIIRFEAPSPAVDVQERETQPRPGRSLPRRTLRPPMLAVALHAAPPSRV